MATEPGPKSETSSGFGREYAKNRIRDEALNLKDYVGYQEAAQYLIELSNEFYPIRCGVCGLELNKPFHCKCGWAIVSD